MVSNPVVTVLMPVYNARKHVREAVESILSQTFRDFEFLIIDDGSTDSTAELIQSYNDHRIRFIRNHENRGISSVLNQGLEAASCNLIARMDADDISYPDRLEKQVAWFRQDPQVALLSTWARVITAGGAPVRTEKWNPRYYYYNLNFACWIYHPTVMYRRDAVFSSGKYSTRYAEDHNLWWQVSRHYKMDHLPQVLLDYRLADDSLSRVTRKSEYDAAQKAQVLRNIRYYTGPDFSLNDEETQCLMMDCEALLNRASIQAIATAFRKLSYVNRCILEKPNINRNEEAIREAAAFKWEWTLSIFARHLPAWKFLLLLLRLGNYDRARTLLKNKLFRKRFGVPAVSASIQERAGS